jgi:hypothetical protein
VGKGSKANLVIAEVGDDSPLSDADVGRLLDGQKHNDFSVDAHSIKQGFSRMLASYKERTGKTNKEIGLIIGVSEPVVSKMLRVCGQFTIDFFIEKLGRARDPAIQSRIDLIRDISRLA